MPYSAPVADYLFIFNKIVNFKQLTQEDRFSEVTMDLVAAILEEAGKISTEVLAPLQRVGDTNPAFLENGVVRTSPGFGKAYQSIADNGWIGMAASSEYGGMGLPQSLMHAVNEMMGGACLSLQLNPVMTQGQIEALEHHASEDLKKLYLPKLISGEWSGTMNLTEPHAGSDVGALKSVAVPNEDGSYSVSGQKIYISWADNDFTENVCHLVLARLPGSPEGTKGISLFMVPKLIPDKFGQPGVANTLKVVSLEHKLGLHGSPTAVMQYENALGWIVGEPNQGMASMFTMMNNARLGVGGQGIAVAEAAYQKALSFSMERVQGQPLGGGKTILGHADVRRMLAEMKADVFAARAIGAACALAIDMGNATASKNWISQAAFLTPIAKAFGTDIGIEVSQTGIQVHGGMGFIEETGASQFLRDVRVTAIYEGTNGIQAMDLVSRKMKDGGEAAFTMIQEIESFTASLGSAHKEMAASLENATQNLRETTTWILNQNMNDRFSGAVNYLRFFARVLGGYYHLKAGSLEQNEDFRMKLADVYFSRLLPEYHGLSVSIRRGSEDIFALTEEELAR